MGLFEYLGFGKKTETPKDSPTVEQRLGELRKRINVQIQTSAGEQQHTIPTSTAHELRELLARHGITAPPGSVVTLQFAAEDSPSTPKQQPAPSSVQAEVPPDILPEMRGIYSAVQNIEKAARTVKGVFIDDSGPRTVTMPPSEILSRLSRMSEEKGKNTQESLYNEHIPFFFLDFWKMHAEIANQVLPKIKEVVGFDDYNEILEANRPYQNVMDTLGAAGDLVGQFIEKETAENGSPLTVFKPENTLRGFDLEWLEVQSVHSIETGRVLRVIRPGLQDQNRELHTRAIVEAE